MLEITLISAQHIKMNNTSCSSLLSFSSRRLRPFVTISTFPPPPCKSDGRVPTCSLYTTMVDYEGGANPRWDDKFHIPLSSTFLTSMGCVYLKLYTKRALLGQTLLGWIQIPATDLLDGLLPLNMAHHLSYRLLNRDGSRGHGIVNVACKFVGQVPVVGRLPTCFDQNDMAAGDTCRTVTGVPARTWQTERDNMDNKERGCPNTSKVKLENSGK